MNNLTTEVLNFLFRHRSFERTDRCVYGLVLAACAVMSFQRFNLNLRLPIYKDLFKGINRSFASFKYKENRKCSKKQVSGSIFQKS